MSRLPVPRVGSYAYAIAGEKTASGGALLLGSPQVGFTYSYLVDLGAGEGRSVVPPGNDSGNGAGQEATFQATGELPQHAADQIDVYENWEYKPMWRAEYAEHAESQVTLSYAPQGEVETGRGGAEPPPADDGPDPAPDPEEPSPDLPATGAGLAVVAVVLAALGALVRPVRGPRRRGPGR